MIVSRYLLVSWMLRKWMKYFYKCIKYRVPSIPLYKLFPPNFNSCIFWVHKKITYSKSVSRWLSNKRLLSPSLFQLGTLSWWLSNLYFWWYFILFMKIQMESCWRLGSEQQQKIFFGGNILHVCLNRYNNSWDLILLWPNMMMSCRLWTWSQWSSM